MSDRKFGNLMPRRQGVSWRTYDLINRRTCLHVDAWVYQDNDDRLYFHVDYSIGGRQIHERATWHIDIAGNTFIPAPTLTVSDISRMVKRTINHPFMHKHYPMLAAMHDVHMLPRIWADMGAAFKGYRSVALNYIWTNPRINEPMEGILNHYATTRRAERDEGFVQGGPPRWDNSIHAQYERAMRLPPKERSIMRTLDKVLRNQNST